ncbi:hypothetical protein [Sulfuriferula sp.]|uniref:hypothetical protein n=1 Tax=Sulfuriferula sp. TaxID=2025307 RepID=UPI00272FD6F1|nr:hypothetical protein [Sulfuriferula sp.]MDP1620556.1 hypothetical protein [bacterium]MDP2026417.1 hypothetical protein [Sulfuriferula sp.]
MKSRPILFSAPMVRAIIEGRKTMTRRVVKLPKALAAGNLSNAIADQMHGVTPGLHIPMPDGSTQRLRNPWGWPEPSQLWVRETCRAEELPSGLDGVRYAADGAFRETENTRDAAEAWIKLNYYRGGKGLTVPTIHMPRWASRITLEITGMRVERLNEISGADCIAEGIIEAEAPQYAFGLHEAYQDLWESINGPGSWYVTPWVWVIEFAVVKP